MNQRIAILDLGTNTFHLKIGEINSNNEFQVLFKTKVFVKLGEDGFEKIGKAPFRRGKEVIRYFRSEIDEYQVDEIYSYATAAFREAKNGTGFLQFVKEQYNINVEIISGEKEAELIYYGVKETQILTSEPMLIMDIGGGSLELIIANKYNVFWKDSFPLGGSKLREQFHKTEPISLKEQEELDRHIAKSLIPLTTELRNYKIQTLVGCSGSFSTIVEMIDSQFYFTTTNEEKVIFDIDMKLYNAIHEQLILSTLEERLNIEGLVPMRAEMIVVATIIINYIVKIANISKMIYSTYSLKEGMIHLILNR